MRKIHLYILIAALAFSAPAAAAADTTAPVGAEGNTNLSNDPPSGTDTQQTGTDTQQTGTDTQQTGTDSQQTGTDAQPAVQLKGTIPASQAADLLAAFLQQYLKDSERSELFYQYVRRAGADVLQNILDQVNAADGKEHDLTKSA